jgi:hypothetical protein
MSATPIIQLLILGSALACFGASNSLDSAVLSFPDLTAEKYRPDVAAECANILISAGKDRACAALEGLAKANSQLDRHINENICHLTRLLFVPTNFSEPLRAPRIGALSGMPRETMNPSAWPELPFVIVSNVPLSMSLGYLILGRPERAGNYLTYCRANGNFRSTPFTEPSALVASNVLAQVLTSIAWSSLKWKDEGLGWSYTYDEGDAKESLWKQVENIANQTVQRTGASRSAEETNQTSSAAGPRR